MSEHLHTSYPLSCFFKGSFNFFRAKCPQHNIVRSSYVSRLCHLRRTSFCLSQLRLRDLWFLWSIHAIRCIHQNSIPQILFLNFDCSIAINIPISYHFKHFFSFLKSRNHNMKLNRCLPLALRNNFWSNSLMIRNPYWAPIPPNWNPG